MKEELVSLPPMKNVATLHVFYSDGREFSTELDAEEIKDSVRALLGATADDWESASLVVHLVRETRQ